MKTLVLALLISISTSLLAETASESTGLQAYIQELLADNMINNQELEQFLKACEQKEFHNPISKQASLTAIEQHIHYRGLETYRNAKLDWIALAKWSGDLLQERGHNRRRREETEQ